MKKAVIFMMTLSILLGSSVFARAYEEEITFEGVPWGSEIGEVKEYLTKLYADDYWFFDPVSDSAWFFAQSGDRMDLNIREGCKYLEAHANTTYYGYEPEKVLFNFCPGGKKNREEILQLIWVELKTEDREAAYEDLSLQLSEDFGDYAVSTDGMIMTESRYWTGQENTAVMVFCSGVEDLVYLCYGVIR